MTTDSEFEWWMLVVILCGPVATIVLVALPRHVKERFLQAVAVSDPFKFSLGSGTSPCNFRLPDLGRVSRGFPGNGLGTFSFEFLHHGRTEAAPVPTRLRRVAHSNGCAIRPGTRMTVCLAAIPCRQRATRRSRVGTLPRINAVRDSKSAIPVSGQVRKSEFWQAP